MKRFLAILVIACSSCSGPQIDEKVKKADRIQVIDGKTGFSHTDSTKSVVEGFKEMFKAQPVVTDCQPQGRVLFREGDKVLLDVGYYKDASACNYLIVEKKGRKLGYPLSFNALAYLGMHFQELKQIHGKGSY